MNSLDYFKNHKGLLPVYELSSDDEISYKLNSDGYRSLEWDQINWSESVIVFGCSNVFGVGLQEEETFTGQLQALLGRPVINLGVQGSSISFVLHNTLKYIEHFPNPWAVINLWTSLERFHRYLDSGIFFDGIWSSKKSQDFFYHWSVKNKINSETHSYFNILAIRELWKNRTIHLESSFFDLPFKNLGCPCIKIIDYARDNQHPGFETNKIAADYFYRRLKDKK